MTFRFSDPYRQMLEDQAKALTAREADVASREAQLKADREGIARDRAKLDIAREHYEAFLATQRAQREANLEDFRGPMPLSDGTESHHGVRFKEIPLPLRMGVKRRRVLDAVATAGQGQTTREIAEKSDVHIDVVRNIVAEECRQGIFARQGDKLYMTPAGLDYLNRATVKFGPPQKETSPSMLDEVLQ